MRPTQTQLSKDDAKRLLAFAFAAGAYLTWWDSFHEVGRFFMHEPIGPAFGDLLYSTVSCFLKPAGIVVGCIAAAALFKRRKNPASSKTVVGLFATEFVLQSIYYAAATLGALGAADAAYALISACTVLNVVLMLRFAGAFKTREVAFAACVAIGCYAFFNNLVFPALFLSAPLVAIAVFYSVVFIGAGALSFYLIETAPAAQETPYEHGFEARTPLPLAGHLLAYGSAFGILHILGGYVAQGPYSINRAVFFACIVAIACIAVLFLRKTSDGEVWAKIRSAVFPLSVIGYLLIPLVSDSDAALALTEASNLLYSAIFLIGCLVLTRKTGIDPRAVVIKGLFWKYLGTTAGVVYARACYGPGFLDGNAYSMLSVVIVALLSVATFWVGSDKRISKIWGLRKNLPAKHYRNLVHRCKCDAVAREYRLTAREEEVLLLSVQGMRPAEVADAIGVSVDTVRSHIKHLYAKLDVHSAKDLRDFVEKTEIDEGELVL